MRRQAVFNQISNCRECHRLVKSRRQVVLGFGQIPAGFMFIGLSPGRNGADVTGIPFTRDPSGILFQEAMKKAGFSLGVASDGYAPILRDAYVTNLVKCNPRDQKGNNRAPSKGEIQNCLRYLRIERELVRPRVIVTLGKYVTECLIEMKIGRLSNIHGKEIIKDGIIYIPFLHPSYVIRGAYERKKYIQEFKSIREISGNHTESRKGEMTPNASSIPRSPCSIVKSRLHKSD